VMEGALKVGDKIRMMATEKEFDVTELGTFRPAQTPAAELAAGDVGFIIASMKNVNDVTVGDTITLVENPALLWRPGYRPVKSMVYCGLYPVENAAYNELRDALDKLRLNDASLIYEPESSAALGFGFRCGFLGLLHMEIVQERLEREHDLNLIATAPSVVYHVYLNDGRVTEISNPADLPLINLFDHLEEPFVKAMIIMPGEYVGSSARRNAASFRTWNISPPRECCSPMNCRWLRFCSTSLTS
jgi:GTP-binding protein LepA